MNYKQQFPSYCPGRIVILVSNFHEITCTMTVIFHVIVIRPHNVTNSETIYWAFIVLLLKNYYNKCLQCLDAK